MAKYRTVRTPAPDELWQRGSTYYVVQPDSSLLKLQFEPEGIANPFILQHRIQQTYLLMITHSGSTVCHDQDGWICLADNWVDYVTKSFQQSIEDFRIALAYCETALSRPLLGTIK